MTCDRFVPDLMAGGSDCANCGWPQEDHERKDPEEMANTTPGPNAPDVPPALPEKATDTQTAMTRAACRTLERTAGAAQCVEAAEDDLSGFLLYDGRVETLQQMLRILARRRFPEREVGAWYRNTNGDTDCIVHIHPDVKMAQLNVGIRKIALEDGDYLVWSGWGGELKTTVMEGDQFRAQYVKAGRV